MERALDFWIGTWECMWEGGRGINRIARGFDDRVVIERFEAVEPEPFTGMSLSVFDPNAGWRQTWVDSNGSYWHFTGAAIDGGFVFATPEPVDDERLLKRMVFSDIRPASFDWRWEASPDGISWAQRWAIHYRRT